MTRKRRRLIVVLACGLGLGSATGLSLWALSSDVAFFSSPSQLLQQPPGPGRSVRLGGLVVAGSVTRTTEDGKPAASFRVTDGAASVTVNFVGILPDLFREGQGVVTLGSLAPDGTFRFHFRFPDASYSIPIIAESPDGVEQRSASLRFERATARTGDVGHTAQPAHLGTPMGKR